MTKLFFLIICIAAISRAPAQKLTGLWYSSDSSRIYEIRETSINKFTATLKSSHRPKDSVGYVILNNLSYNIRKKRYEGIIYAVSDGQPDFVKIKFDKKNDNKLNLKLSRMLIMDISIYWVKDKT